MLPTLRFHHIGIATPGIKGTADYYVNAGYSISDTIYDSEQNVSVAFLEKEGMPKIELVEPGQSLTESSNHPVNRIIEKSGVTPYHVCYETENMASSIYELKKKKYLLLTKPTDAAAMNNRKICFLYNQNVGLIELLEKTS